MGFTCIMCTNTFLVGRYWDFKVVFHRIENIVGKEENAGYQHFLLFPLCFQKRLFPQVIQKSSLCGNGLKIRIFEEKTTAFWTCLKYIYANIKLNVFQMRSQNIVGKRNMIFLAFSSFLNVFL